MIDPSKISRWRATATTWMLKTVNLLTNGKPRNADEAWLIGYEATRFMQDVLGDLERLAPLLDAEQGAESERAVIDLLGAVRSHRLAAKLENVSGRSAAEAEEFLSKAAQLRQR